ncbi:MAG: hypothetical protein DMF13_09610 [Verrucomicrobia bacterium]|nr:MAG: hypothetical protein DMF13_09610 [Verrucomicrobiota bacterium]
MPTFFRPGGLQFRCFISGLITARQFSLDQAYFILLGQRHPTVGVFGQSNCGSLDLAEWEHPSPLDKSHKDSRW